MKRYGIIVLFILFINFSAFSQSKSTNDSIKNIIRKIVDDAIDNEKIKDSTAVYGLSIVLNITLKGNYQEVDVNTNNSELISAIDFNTLYKLKKVDYRLLMKDKKTAKFSFKVYFVVYDSKFDKKVKLEDVSKSVQYLILKDEFDIPNLGFKLTILDKQIYH